MLYNCVRCPVGGWEWGTFLSSSALNKICPYLASVLQPEKSYCRSGIFLYLLLLILSLFCTYTSDRQNEIASTLFFPSFFCISSILVYEVTVSHQICRKVIRHDIIVFVSLPATFCGGDNTSLWLGISNMADKVHRFRVWNDKVIDSKDRRVIYLMAGFYFFPCFASFFFCVVICC